MPTISINPQYFLDLGTMPFGMVIWRLLLDGGWVLLIPVFWFGFTGLWLNARRAKYAETLTFTVLAIDVPKANLQTVKAVEHIFSHFAVGYAWGDNIDKWWHGKFTPPFSFEIVSLDGYVQFLVRCPSKYRDMVEASIYSQYPDAEIIEVADYTDKVPVTYPDQEWDLFGTELVLAKPWSLPIRTHEAFEHTGAEVVFKDPMSSLLESMSMLKHGEQLWLQILVTPTDGSWKDKSEEFANKMVGKKPPEKKSPLDAIFWLPNAIIKEFMDMILGGGEAVPEKKPEASQKLLSLTPGEKNVLEAVQEKATKVGFSCKIRIVYVAHRNVFSKGRLSGVNGAFAQFAIQNMNSFRPYGPVMPSGTYFYQRWSEQTKKMALLRNYRNRSMSGATSYILNVEELATIYHFPMEQVKASQVQKTEAKRAEPPSSLPTRESAATGLRHFQPIKKAAPPVKPAAIVAPLDADADLDEDAAEPPSNLPLA
ncbi:hypothetical protein A3C96_02215 [Candidatus Uhrbacteria bacterium RIFCSPHIGHO2_02_FULL_60_10]|uniref:DUF8128 domain-containing protein n=1 Tax=Candidatus Uhrbacteria bacterium RIFCSPHIGHO2_02_FULL_60_10 TaxID=1802392 RepID=A0A1F7U3I8_9BACT|nr:MAG: hypothetical protein A3C96_02215 [Candidatus Uhrbacteria bacterium RIFCSPHIGHO2_02_FULL_60_10]